MAAVIEYVDVDETEIGQCYNHNHCSDWRENLPKIGESKADSLLYLRLEKDALLVKTSVKYCLDSGMLKLVPNLDGKNNEIESECVYKIFKGRKNVMRRVFRKGFGSSGAARSALRIFCDKSERFCIQLNQIREVRKIEGEDERCIVEDMGAVIGIPEERECAKYLVFYGSEFQLGSMEIWAFSKSGEEVMESVWSWVEHFVSLPYPFHIRAVARRYFNQFLQGDKETISASHCKKICISIGYGSCLTATEAETGRDKFSNDFNEASENGEMNFNGFYKLFRGWLNENNEKILQYCFREYNPEVSSVEVRLNKRSYTLVGELNSGNDFGKCIVNSDVVAKEDFVDFIFSEANGIWDPKISQVYQDMTEPLWKYWVSTSHNTYLSGHQLVGVSTVEAYIRCLSLGSRCIELDCWDGRNGMPIIKHGWTLTTKISFVSVLKAINDHGFKHSDYPLILSIENHCCPKQQQFMAEKLVEILGERLHKADNDDIVRSPEDLRGKVLVKCKVGDCLEISTSDPDFMHEKKKVYLFNSEAGAWEEYIMGLTDTELRFMKLPKIQRRSVGQTVWESCDDLHELEKWFHGRIQPQEAHIFIREYNKEGCFLVRKSTGADGFVLVFLHNDVIRDFRIQKENCSYYLQPTTSFDSLFSLITHYQQHPIKAKSFEISRLGEPVAVRRNLDYSSEVWFHGDLTREEAERVLRKFEFDGLFTVRNSTSKPEPNKYIISFQCKQILTQPGTLTSQQRGSAYSVFVKHCRIRYDGCHFVVADKKFESLSDLILYYQQNPFYKGIKLKTPVSSDMCRQALEALEEGCVLKPGDAGPGYIYTYDANSLELKVRAITEYHKPDDPDALSFRKGDIITNVNPDDDEDTGWCRGDCKGMMQKRFPTSHVEEFCGSIEEKSKANAAKKGPIPLRRARIMQYKPPEKESKQQNSGEMVRRCVNDGDVTCIIKIEGNETSIGVKDQQEALAWKKTIKEVLNRRRGPQRMMECMRKNIRESLHGVSASKKMSGGLEQLVYLPGGSPSQDVGGNKSGGKKMSQKRVTSIKSGEIEKVAKNSSGTSVSSLHSNTFIWRTYPDSMDSSNYDPTLRWNYGVQLVALNFQTADKWMALNQGKFFDNGQSGYILKPSCLRDTCGLRDCEPLGSSSEFINIGVVAARNLTRNGEKVSNPFVVVEILGTRNDMAKKLTSFAEDNNGLNPFWGEIFGFYISNPELAQVRFTVNDKDSFADSHFVGQATFPLKCLRIGLRSVRLRTNFGEDLSTPSVLLVQYRKSGINATIM